MNSGQQLMNALVLETFGSKLQLKKLPIPSPQSSQVLVKMMSCSINPSDIAFISGTFASKKKLPIIPGTEGSGIVLESGGGMLGWKLKGKKVGVIANDTMNGTWSEYMVTDSTNCIELDDDTTFNEGSSCFVNPMTALSMLDLCKMNNYKAVINTAAASALGLMINRLFKNNGISVINVVRKEEQESLLKKEGFEYIFNQEDSEFDQKMKDITSKLQAICLLDAVSGKLTQRILKIMPIGSTAYIYGSLESDNFFFQPGDLIFKRKTIKGFWMSLWVKNKGLVGKAMMYYNLKTMLKTILKTNVQKEFSLEKVDEAIEYYQNRMSQGKVILKPNENESKL